MSEATDTLNTGEVIEALGRAWTLSHVSPRIRAGFSAWCKARARREITDLAGCVNEDEYQEQLSAFNLQLTTGDFRWGSPTDDREMGRVVRTLLRTADGQRVLLGLMLKKAHGDVPAETLDEVMAAEPLQVGEAMRRALDLPDPNSPAPGAPGTGTANPAEAPAA